MIRRWMLLGVVLATTPVLAAQSPVLFSPDVTAQFGTLGPVTVSDNEAARDDAAGTVTIPPDVASMFGTIPASVEVAGFELSNSPAVGWLLTVDTTAALPGLPAGTSAEPRDVVHFDPDTITFSVYFDGSANSVPDGVAIDAVAVNASDQLLLSFDTSVTLPGVGGVDDEDLVRFASGTWSIEYNGSVFGVPGELDLDAAQRAPTANTLLLSFDGSGSVGGVPFDDEDVIAFDTGSFTYAMHFDGSVSDPTDWPGADLVALPEPGMDVTLLCGLVALAALRIWRTRCRAAR